MTKLTLEQAWEECLAMWEWIVREWSLREGQDVPALKRRYLEAVRKEERYLNDYCYFCAYHWQHTKKNETRECTQCPGRLVSPSFSCYAHRHHWIDKPKEFLKKIKALNKKRKQQPSMKKGKALR